MDEEDFNRKRADLWHFRRYAGPRIITNPSTWPNSWLAAATGFGLQAASFYFYGRWYKRPWYSALHFKVAGCLTAAGIGYALGAFREYHLSTRDAVVEHYMQLHPEDFEHLSGKGGRKYKDLFLPWQPIRVQERLKSKET